MFIRGIIMLAFFAMAHCATGQVYFPDTLEAKFAGQPQDSAYVDRLNLTASEYLKTNPAITRKVISHSLKVAPQIKYVKGYARALTILGNSYWYEGMYEFAQNYYLLAARQYQEIHDSIGVGQTFNNIGEIYKKLGEYDKALSYLLKAQHLLKQDSLNQPLTLYNIGELYVFLNNLPEAKKYVDESLQIARRQGNKKVIAYDYWSLAAICRKENDYKKAFDFYTHAELIWLELGEIRALIQTHQEIADFFTEQKRYTEAEAYLVKAMKAASGIRVPDLQVINFGRMSRLDSLRGDYRRSLYFLSRHNSLKDSVYSLLKAEQIARLQTIYETEKQEKENESLRSEKELKDTQLLAQQVTLIAITAGLIVTGVLAWFLYRQRKKILLQKEAIEMQAVALMKLNEELQNLNKTLEARIEQRTSQLTVQNQRITEYTFINAHKLRAPVASILGLINLLAHSTASPEEKEEIVSHLKTCSEQLDQIIRQVSVTLEEALVSEHFMS